VTPEHVKDEVTLYVLVKRTVAPMAAFAATMAAFIAVVSSVVPLPTAP